MKKESIIITILILILMIVISFVGFSSKKESSDGFLFDIAQGINYNEWLFGNTREYGDGIIEIKKKCFGNKIIEETWEIFKGTKTLTGSRIIGECSICKTCDFKTLSCVNDDGAPCKAPNVFYGVCINGECKASECGNLIGEDKFGFSECGNLNLKTCCGKGEECCGENTRTPICCNSEKGEYCVKELNLLALNEINERRKEVMESSSNAKDTILPLMKIVMDVSSRPESFSNFCQITKESCEKKGMKLCPGTRGGVCCSLSETCLTYSPATVDFISAIYELNNALKRNGFDEVHVPEITLGACGYPKKYPPEKSCPTGTTLCPNFGLDNLLVTVNNEEGIICCKEGEECVNRDPYCSPQSLICDFYPPFCQRASCDETKEEECSTRPFIDPQPIEPTEKPKSIKTIRFRECCKKGLEICVRDPKGLNPRCVPKPERIGNPSTTTSTSIYMIRKENNFVLDGKAFVIEPHIEFQKPATITINDEIKEDEEVFKYTSHEAVLENCESEKINKITKTVGTRGGKISLDNEIIVDIPENALKENTEFSITSYELTNCYEVGKKETKPIYINIHEEINETPKKGNKIFFIIIIFSAIIVLIILVFLIISYFRIKKMKIRRTSN